MYRPSFVTALPPAVFAAFATVVLALCSTSARAEPSPQAPATPVPVNSAGGDNRYGLFGLLDHRSQYGVGVFPEPFLVDDSDLEVGELRLDWFHQEKRGHQADEVTAEVEKGFGLLTIEVEVHYERDQSRAFSTITGDTTTERDEGLGNIDIGARYPIYQYVSNDQFIDNTLGVGFEVGVPSNSRISKNTEIVPKIFDDLRIGEHFTLQSIIGYSMLKGPKPGSGPEALEYGFDFGWTIQHHDLPIPNVESIIPVFEIAGEIPTNGEDSGHSNVTGVAAVRVNLKAINRIQPRLGAGYLFPMDKGARDDFRWGGIVSLVFEF